MDTGMTFRFFSMGREVFKQVDNVNDNRYRLTNMRIQSCSILLLLVSLAWGLAEDDNYQLDLLGPDSTYPWTPLPNKVEIYASGPSIGYDEELTWFLLHGRKPDYLTTNHDEILNLVAGLNERNGGDHVKVTGEKGYTFHLLFFRKSDGTLMHYRVFDPLNNMTNLVNVYPLSVNHHSYSNNKVGYWLHERINVSKNSGSAK
jgi:hypothetical protein